MWVVVSIITFIVGLALGGVDKDNREAEAYHRGYRLGRDTAREEEADT